MDDKPLTWAKVEPRIDNESWVLAKIEGGHRYVGAIICQTNVRSYYWRIVTDNQLSETSDRSGENAGYEWSLEVAKLVVEIRLGIVLPLVLKNGQSDFKPKVVMNTVPMIDKAWWPSMFAKTTMLYGIRDIDGYVHEIEAVARSNDDGSWTLSLVTNQESTWHFYDWESVRNGWQKLTKLPPTNKIGDQNGR